MTALIPSPRMAAVARPLAAIGAAISWSGTLLFNRGRGWGVIVARSRFDYKGEVGDPATNSIVGAVVGWIARNFPDAPVRIIREDDPDARPFPRAATGPGAMLRLLEKPNDWYSGVLQWKATLVDYICGSDAYWLKERNDADRVVGLWWVPEHMMEPRWDQNDPRSFIDWYEYTVDGIPYAIEPRDVVHFRNGIDPKNPRKGRSELSSVLREIFTDEEGANFTASLLRNLGVPGVVLAPANTTGRLGLEADPEKVKRSFMDKFGGDNRGEPLVLSAPTDVKVLSWSPDDMNLKDLRRIPEERISAVTGVPAGVAGLGAGLDRNTFTNYGEARKAGYEEGIATLQRQMAADLENQLLPDFADADLLDVFFDLSKVPAMQEAAGEVEKRDQAAATKGLMTRRQYKLRRGQQPAEDGSDDVYILPNNYVVIEAPAPGGQSADEPRVLIGKPNTPQLGPGTGAVAAEPGAVELKCAAIRPTGDVCGRVLAVGPPPIRAFCQRCKAWAESPAVAA